mmetsp:Transcript_99562/g.138317  ORF Transcript_99562/g.138317 Transcript_99562/m.138317 type:complete len:331 (+) Transcript_99562:200-1192(+)
MMCVACTPSLMALRQQVTFGIIPPATMPSSMSFEAPVSSTSEMREPESLTSRRMPGTSVMRTNSSASKAPAMAAAAMSAFTFKKLPSESAATVATTGTSPLSRAAVRTSFLTPVTSPTKPSSSSSTFFACSKPPSTPLSPTAATPAAPMVATMPLFTLPMRTMATTSIVAASVTRSPRTNFGSIPTFASQLLISGPPPWMRTGFRPRAFSSATSRMVRSGDFTMAAPPYLITTTEPVSFARAGKDSARACARVWRSRGGASSSSSSSSALANLISSPCVAASTTRLEPKHRLCRCLAATAATAAPIAVLEATEVESPLLLSRVVLATAGW